MKSLKQASKADIKDHPEADIMKNFENRVIDESEFYELLNRGNIDQNISKQGTFYPKEGGNLFAYAKKHFISPTLPAAQIKLEFCREMTRRGVFFPETKWGILKRPSGNYQVYAIMRKLELAPAAKDPLFNSNLLEKRLGPSFLHALDSGEANRNEMGHLPNSSELFAVDIEVIGMAFNEDETIKKEIEFQRKGINDIIEL